MGNRRGNSISPMQFVALSLTLSSPTLSAQTSDSDVSNASSEVEQVEVIGNAQSVDSTEINPNTKKLLRVAGAASDPLAALQSLPGVTFGSDGDTAPAVRGSAPEDNTYLVDFIPAAYVFHIFGDSIFNENIIQSFDLYPAAYGSRYGNATGAAIDVTLRDPKNQKMETTLDYSLLRTGAFIETGLTDDQAVYFSYRRSLIDLYLDTGTEEDGIKIKKPPVADDYQLKYVWDKNSTSKLSIVLAGASDRAKADFSAASSEAAEDPDFLGPAAIDQRFDSQGIIWDKQFTGNGSSLKTAFSHSDESTQFSYGNNQFIESRTELLTYKTEYSLPLSQNHWLITGGSVTNLTFRYDLDAKISPCSYFDPDCSSVDAPRFQLKDIQKVNLYTYYLEDEWYITDDWVLTPGLHFSTDDYLKDDFTEARLRSRYNINDQWVMTAAVGQYHQLPAIDEVLSVIGNPNLKSPEATHYVIGIEQTISSIWNWKSEIYYKDLKNQVLSLSEAIDADFAKKYSNDASGKAYGLEFLLNRNLSESWYGWASISASKTERTNDRTGQTQPFDYDRPVIINLVANYQINYLWNIGFRWKAQSGALYTPIVGLVNSNTQAGVQNPVYGKTNSERLPAYHRLDIRIERVKNHSWGSFTFFTDLLNAYGKENIDGYEYAPNGKNLVTPPSGYASNIPVTKTAGLGFFPSIGVKVTF